MSDEIEITDILNFHTSTKQRDNEYLNSKKWFCQNSPTKSHFWEVKPSKYKKDLLINTQKCKFCDKEKIIVIKDKD